MRRFHILIVAALLPVLAACGPGQPSGTGATAAPSQTLSTAQPATAVPAAATPQPLPATAIPQPAATPPPTAAPAPATAVPVPEPAGPQRISFAAGATSGALDGAVVRGTEQRYVFGAAAGQLLKLQIDALEHNAVFALFDPSGRALAGAEPGRDATDWSGTLPATGDYQIAVGATRGNATFHIDITIADPAPSAQPLRGVDWNALIAADPALAVSQLEGRPYVAVRGADPGVGGIPLLDNIIYVDMDGDRIEEAAITLNSGGTASNIGFLVYRQASPAPQLVAWQGGYKLGLLVEGGRLVARNALYAGWEPNCCPSGFTYDTYTLQNGQLQQLAHRDEGIPEMQAATVEQFYQLLGRKELKTAYALLADAERAANSYDSWAAGYANTIAIQATAAADPAVANTVRVDLSATDRAADGGQVSRRFVGAWKLVWGGAGRGWLLADPQIHAV
ncbi:MAG TPA: hypothetical protein VFU22_18230 [Roseiflexaceae bacterium]|nr:hypothetical protein [Roseiflexaceae bacterium]